MIAGACEGSFECIEKDERSRQGKGEVDVAALDLKGGRRLSQSKRRAHESEATDNEDEYSECGHTRGYDELEDSGSGNELDRQVGALPETVARSEKTEPHET